MKVIETVVTIILFPFFIVFFTIFMVLWLILTVTGVGPLLQYCFNRSDRVTLDRDNFAKNNSDMKVVTVSGHTNSCSLGDPYKVFAIFSQPSSPSKYPPVCIPNGLGATAVLISQMQERLVECGFTVLNFDRLGVGMSDANKSKKSPTGEDLVREMDFVMNHFMPADTKWILLGPSMGSIVAQCYIARHPEKVVGFLNMDGLPYPFINHKSLFLWAGFIYKVYASIIWTGVLRPFIGVALKSSEKMFRCKQFPLSVVVAQMNRAQFFGNVGLEMGTMMDCCAMAESAWGTYSLLKMDKADLEALIRARPDKCIEFDDATDERRETTFRSPSERGDAWAPSSDTEAAMSHLKKQASHAGATYNAVIHESDANSLLAPLSASDSLVSYPHNQSVLGERWQQLVVRVMSARNHDFGNAMANAFYHQAMRDMAAAEHAVHSLLALDGKRTAYPRISHTVMFSKTDDIVRCIQEIALALEQKSSTGN